MMPALEQATATYLGIGKLIAGALFDRLRPLCQQAQIVERAEALERLKPQIVRKPLHGFGQDQLHVPGIGDDHVIRIKRPDGSAVASLDRIEFPARPVKLQCLAFKGKYVPDMSDPPFRIAHLDVTDFIQWPR
jgi:hypothetical protein